MQDFLAAATIVVRRRGETVIASKNAIDKHPVVLPVPAVPGRFEIREGANVNDGKHFAIVWAPLSLVGDEPARLLPVLAFRDADDAKAALLKIEKAFTRPWWRKAVRVYQVLGFIVAVLGTLAFWNTLSIGHAALQGQPVAAANGPQSADQLAATPNGLDPAVINALLARPRSALQSQLHPGVSGGSAEQPTAQSPSPYTIQPPAPVAPATPAPTDAGSPGDAVVNALGGAKK